MIISKSAILSTAQITLNRLLILTAVLLRTVPLSVLSVISVLIRRISEVTISVLKEKIIKLIIIIILMKLLVIVII